MHEHHTCPECGYEFEAGVDQITEIISCPSCGEPIGVNAEQEPDESMDGDFDSGMRDAGFGTDEDYGPGASEIE